MKKQKFVLAEASLDEINKQLKINMFTIVMLILVLFMNIAQFMRGYSLLYGVLIAIMAFFLFVMAKSRTLLTMRKQELTK
jgi:F0F1-type ATP synthase assembly protein I